MNLRAITAAVAIASLFAAPAFAAQTQGGSRAVHQSAANVITIGVNRLATIDEVSIGAYNFRDNSAALAIAIKGDPSKEQKLRVKAGEKFTAGSKSFEVKSVDASEVQLIVK